MSLLATLLPAGIVKWTVLEKVFAAHGGRFAVAPVRRTNFHLSEHVGMIRSVIASPEPEQGHVGCSVQAVVAVRLIALFRRW